MWLFIEDWPENDWSAQIMWHPEKRIWVYDQIEDGHWRGYAGEWFDEAVYKAPYRVKCLQNDGCLPSLY